VGGAHQQLVQTPGRLGPTHRDADHPGDGAVGGADRYALARKEVEALDEVLRPDELDVSALGERRADTVGAGDGLREQRSRTRDTLGSADARRVADHVEHDATRVAEHGGVALGGGGLSERLQVRPRRHHKSPLLGQEALNLRVREVLRARLPGAGALRVASFPGAEDRLAQELRAERPCGQVAPMGVRRTLALESHRDTVPVQSSMRQRRPSVHRVTRYARTPANTAAPLRPGPGRCRTPFAGMEDR
jgi:hypothetical protein